jgi:hypothetical protein
LDGSEELRLLDEAVTAFRNALTVHVLAEMPVDWARTQNNLGAALHSRGSRTGGPDGLRLLEEAVTAYRGALIVHTRADMPAIWALTQENIGLVLEAMVEADPDGARAYLVDAKTALAAALNVFTPEQMPHYHAKATAALARVHAKLAALDG